MPSSVAVCDPPVMRPLAPLALVTAAALSACTPQDDSRRQPATDSKLQSGTPSSTPSSTGSLTVSLARGPAIRISASDITLICGPLQESDASAVTAVVNYGAASSSRTDPALLLQVVLDHGNPIRTVAMPTRNGVQGHERGALVFVGRRAGSVQLSSSTEESSGSIVVEEAGCDPARLAVTVQGRLASEYADRPPGRVSGELRLRS